VVACAKTTPTPPNAAMVRFELRELALLIKHRICNKVNPIKLVEI
jgi:hypothetical protein